MSYQEKLAEWVGRGLPANVIVKGTPSWESWLLYYYQFEVGVGLEHMGSRDKWTVPHYSPEVFDPDFSENAGRKMRAKYMARSGL